MRLHKSLTSFSLSLTSLIALASPALAVRVVALVQPVEECCRLLCVCQLLRGLVDAALDQRVREAGGSVAVVAEEL